MNPVSHKMEPLNTINKLSSSVSLKRKSIINHANQYSIYKSVLSHATQVVMAFLSNKFIVLNELLRKHNRN